MMTLDLFNKLYGTYGTVRCEKDPQIYGILYDGMEQL